MWMDTYVKAAKRALCNQYWCPRTGGTPEDPIVQAEDGVYVLEINNKLDFVEVYQQALHVGNFNPTLRLVALAYVTAMEADKRVPKMHSMDMEDPRLSELSTKRIHQFEELLKSVAGKPVPHEGDYVYCCDAGFGRPSIIGTDFALVHEEILRCFVPGKAKLELWRSFNNKDTIGTGTRMPLPEPFEVFERLKDERPELSPALLEWLKDMVNPVAPLYDALESAGSSELQPELLAIATRYGHWRTVESVLPFVDAVDECDE